MESYHNGEEMKTRRAGHGGVNNVYLSSTYQRGHGIGGFLGGIMRKTIPYAKQTAKEIGKEVGKKAFRRGMNTASNFLDKHLNAQDSPDERSSECAKNLKRTANEKIDTLMQGSGYKMRNIDKSSHSRAELLARRDRSKNKKLKKRVKSRALKKKKTTKKKTKKSRTVEDIFQ